MVHFRLQVQGLSDQCRCHLQTMVEVDSLKSLLQLVVSLAHLEGLCRKIQKFIASTWKELTENGLLISLMQDERFTYLVAEAASNYGVRKSEDDD